MQLSVDVPPDDDDRFRELLQDVPEVAEPYVQQVVEEDVEEVGAGVDPFPSPPTPAGRTDVVVHPAGHRFPGVTSATH